MVAGHSVVAALGAPSVAGAVLAARSAGMTALVLAAVADFAVLRPDPATGLRARRDSGLARRTRTTSASWRESARP